MDDKALELLNQKYDCIIKKLESLEVGRNELKSELEKLKKDAFSNRRNISSAIKNILEGLNVKYERLEKKYTQFYCMEQESDEDGIEIQHSNGLYYKKWWLIVAGGCIAVTILFSSMVYVVHQELESPSFKEYRHQVEVDIHNDFYRK